MPTLENLQVQYLVAFMVGLLGELIQELSVAFQNFGVTVADLAADSNVMAELTTGLFGTNSGLIYWLNDKMFYVIENMPWCDLGNGLGGLAAGLMNPACP
jgi:hypothetical protein